MSASLTIKYCPDLFKVGQKVLVLTISCYLHLLEMSKLLEFALILARLLRERVSRCCFRKKVHLHLMELAHLTTQLGFVSRSEPASALAFPLVTLKLLQLVCFDRSTIQLSTKNFFTNSTRIPIFFHSRTMMVHPLMLVFTVCPS